MTEICGLPCEAPIPSPESNDNRTNDCSVGGWLRTANRWYLKKQNPTVLYS